MKERSWWRSSRGLKIAVALVLLTGLYWAADWTAVAGAVARLNLFYLTVALLMFVPQTLLSAIRWRRLVASHANLTLRQAARHTLAASALNLVMPSRLGDFSKAAMLPNNPRHPATRPKPERGLSAGVPWLALRARVAKRTTLLTSGAGRVIWEKVADVLALLVLMLGATLGLGDWFLNGGLLVGALAWCALRLLPRESPRRLSDLPVAMSFLSLALWGLHLLQIDLFLKAAGVHVPWDVAAARIPLAIFAGLLPLSFCGLGTRDSALIWLFADVAAAPTMAAVGLLTALRYLVPGAIGIPLLPGCWPTAKTEEAQRTHYEPPSAPPRPRFLQAYR